MRMISSSESDVSVHMKASLLRHCQRVRRDEVKTVAVELRYRLSQGIQPLVEVEKEVILAALEKTGGNKTEAARQLGITRKTLLAKLSR